MVLDITFSFPCRTCFVCKDKAKNKRAMIKKKSNSVANSFYNENKSPIS